MLNELKEEARKVYASLKEERSLEKPDVEKVSKMLDDLDALKAKISVEERSIEADSYWKAPVEKPGEVDNKKDEPIYRSLGEMLKDVHTAAVDRVPERLKRAAAGMSEGTDSAGGYAVAPQFLNDIYSNKETGKLPKYCTSIPIASNRLVITRIAESSRKNGSRQGGVQVYSAAEAAAATKSQHTLSQFTIEAFKAIGLAYATDELLEDEKALGSILTQEFNKEMGFYQDYCVVRGDGTTQAQGILNSSALVSVDRTSTSGIVENDLINMYVAQENPENAVWLMNSECYAQILKLSYTDDSPAFLSPIMGMKNAPNGALFGRPIVKCEQCSALGTKGDIIFTDLNDYWLVTKGGIKSDMSIHVQFLTDQETFRWVIRFGGKTRTQSALAPYLGSVSTSPHVVLNV